MKVARAIGVAQKAAFGVPRAGLAIAGFEVPHTHLHVIPLRDETDILLSKAAPATDEDLDNAITTLREALLAARPRRPRAPVDGIRGALLTDSAPLFLSTPRGRSQPARPPRSGGLMRARASSIGRLRRVR